jgi:hypothetical protein
MTPAPVSIFHSPSRELLSQMANCQKINGMKKSRFFFSSARSLWAAANPPAGKIRTKTGREKTRRCFARGKQRRRFQAFVGRLKQAVAARDMNAIAGMMPPTSLWYQP